MSKIDFDKPDDYDNLIPYIRKFKNKSFTYLDIENLLNDYNELWQEHSTLLKKFQSLQRKENMYIKQIKELQSTVTIIPKRQQIKDSDIEKIKELRKQGLSYSKIVKETGWSKFTVSRVINGFYDK